MFLVFPGDNGMKKTELSFDDFWDFVISPSITTCQNEIDPEFLALAGVRSRNPNEFRLEVEKKYKEKRAWLKDEYLPEEKNPSLDFHKLSSILCRCLIGNKFFTYDSKQAEQLHRKQKRTTHITHTEVLAWEIDNLFINYKLAFLVGEGVAFYDLLFWAQTKINADNEILKAVSDENKAKDIKQRISITEQFKDRLCDVEGGLRPYKKSKTHDDFISSVIVALMKNDCLMRDFDYLMFSAMMFQWQEYTKRCIFSELIFGDSNRYLQFCLK